MALAPKVKNTRLKRQGGNPAGSQIVLFFSAWGICGFVPPAYLAGMLDVVRKQGDLGAGYAQVFRILAVLALDGGGLSLLL